MIKYLKIANLALIENAEVDFFSGFSVITGETGAGKSVFLGALLLALGARADKSLIRFGADRCEISATIQIPQLRRADVDALLEENGVEATDELLIRRVISVEWVRNFVNGSVVNAKLLQQLSALLIDVHSADEHQSLTENLRQLQLLDRYADTEAEKKCCAAIYAELTKLRRERKSFESALPPESEIGLLEKAFNDIEEIAPRPGEDTEISLLFQSAANSRSIIELASGVAYSLDEGENSVLDNLNSVNRRLGELARLTPDAERLLDDNGAIQDSLRELTASLRNLAEKVDLDGAEYAALEKRLGQLNTLKRRYGGTLEAVLSTHNEAADKLERWRSGADELRKFDQREEELLQNLKRACDVLTAKRSAASVRFTAEVSDKLSLLGFAGGRLSACWSNRAADGEGQDELELFFSANIGEPEQPLRKIASSGELSRVMLAIKTVLSDADDIESAVFDEIDVNIGGETANRVADELANLGAKRQILAISHLAQVAAAGTHHYRVSKMESGGRTYSKIELLSPDERVREIARMLGGGAAALDHAASLLK